MMNLKKYFIIGLMLISGKQSTAMICNPFDCPMDCPPWQEKVCAALQLQREKSWCATHPEDQRCK